MYLVEVRDANFNRVGQIDPAYLSIKWVEVFNGVGQGELKLPAEHYLLPALRTPGSGIVITAPGGRVFSARVKSAQVTQNAADPIGTWVISFEDDNVVLQAAVAYPDPANLANAQTVAYDIRTAAGETVMKQYVKANIGSLAIASRKYPWLAVATDLSRGAVATGSARFNNLGELLASIATFSGLGFRCAQVDNAVVFDVYTPVDRSAYVSMDIFNDSLESTEWGYSRPSTTRVLAAGQGVGDARTIVEVTTSASLASETAWGLRWETFKDRRDTDDPVELTQSGVEVLLTEGTTINSLKVVPSDSPNMKYGTDWGLGDIVTVVVDGQPTKAVVTQAAVSISAAGELVLATVGDPVGFNFESRTVATAKAQDHRISNLERSAENTTPWVMPPGTSIEGYWATPPDGFLFEDGALVSRVTYAGLFAVIGTTFGAGNGTTTFGLPNSRGKVAVGLDNSQTEFNALGVVGGAKTVALTATEMPAHTHVQSPHNHTQDAHNHTQTAHNHTQDAHSHGSISQSTLLAPAQAVAVSVTDGGTTRYALRNNTGTVLGTSAATATNNAATAINNAATATNNETTAINASTGGGAAHNNLQPYITKQFAIKF